jgi:uncharacterized protein (DUF58 family)
VIRISKAGWLYIAVTLLLGFGAVNTGNNLIYLIVSVCLSYMVLSGLLGRHNLSSLEVQLTVPEEIYARTEFPLAVTLKNRRRWMPAFLIRVFIDDHDLLFPYIPAKGTETLHILWTFDNRGRYHFQNIAICSVFPFHFFIRCRTFSFEQRGVVFAQPRESSFFQDTLPMQNRKRFAGEHMTDAMGFDVETASIREYLPGDPLKYIHWKASARTGSLKTKEFVLPMYESIVVQFDRVQIENLEERISCVTGFILAMHRRGVPVGLICNGKVFKPTLSLPHKKEMLQELALYGIQ